ncbi:MAG: metallophosphoesterase [Nitrospirales bacterium]
MTKVKPLLLCILITVMLFSTSYPAHAHQTNAPILIPEIPETIFAAGDIAKCDGDDPWSEELLELVGLLPESAGEEREKNEPFLKELLEILHLREETDNYAKAEETASLLHGLKGRILALGDLGYQNGSIESFNECYDRTWGPFKDRTYPVPGNHEYNTKDAVPYFAYWGNRAGRGGKGYYSFDLGGWHIIALNSKLEKKKHRDTISLQHAWLKKDLAATKARCILAYWHHPVFSSGQEGGSQRMKNMLQTLYAAGVSIVLTGHDHTYERFAPQNPDGVFDPARGFREFVAGTGGASLRPLKIRQKNSEFFQADTFGVLKLELYANRYAWEFLPVGGGSALDAGTGSCVLPQKK